MQLTKRVEELESTIRQLQAEAIAASQAVRDNNADVTEAEAFRNLTAEYVSIYVLWIVVVVLVVVSSTT